MTKLRAAEASNPSDDETRQALFRVPFMRPHLPPLESYVDELEEIWSSKMLSNFATQAERFEQGVRRYTRLDRVCAVANGDLGLTLAIKALDLPIGAEVILPSFTFNSTVNAVLWNDLEPRFVDVSPGHYGLDGTAVAEAIGDRTCLIIGVHVFGTPCDVELLTEVAAGRGVSLIFDAAQAFGTWLGDRHVASFGDASVFSFSGTKVVTSGEGGIAIFKDEEPAQRFRYLRSYGFRDDYITRHVGLNGKLSELHAALGCLGIRDVEVATGRRAELAAAYADALSDIDRIAFQEIPPDVRPSHTYFSVDVGNRRDALAWYLREWGIETKAYFVPLYKMPLFENLPRGLMPVTERLGRSLLCLPLYSDMDREAVAYVCSALRDFFHGGEKR